MNISDPVFPPRTSQRQDPAGQDELRNQSLPTVTSRPENTLSTVTFADLLDRSSLFARMLGSLAEGTEYAALFLGGSGSKGNFAGIISGKVGQGGEILLIDCGLSKNQISATFNKLGLQLVSSEVDSQRRVELEHSRVHERFLIKDMLITHLHGDHLTLAGIAFAQEQGIRIHLDAQAINVFQHEDPPVIAHRQLLKGIASLDDLGLIQYVSPQTIVRLGRFVVQTERAIHDVPALAYYVRSGMFSLFHSGDTGSYSNEMLSLAARAQVLLSDCNYDGKIIETAGRPKSVLERSQAPDGHMGNHQYGDLLERISSGAGSDTLQAAVLLHRSLSTNHQEKKIITKQLVTRWNSELANRFCPALLIPDQLPEITLFISQNRTLVVPHPKRADGFFRLSFGETGLSYSAGRDMMPEISHSSRAYALQVNQAINAKPMSVVRESCVADIEFRLPGVLAFVDTEMPDAFSNMLPIVASYGATSLNFALTIDPTQGRFPNLQLDLLAARLDNQLYHRRQSVSERPRFQSSENRIYCTAAILPQEIGPLLSTIENFFFSAMSRPNEISARAHVKWIEPYEIALITSTESVSFDRSKLAKIVISYQNDRGKCTIEVHDQAHASEYLEMDRVTLFLNQLEKTSLASSLKKAGVEWEVKTLKGTGKALRHRGEWRCNEGELEIIGELTKRILYDGEI